MYQRMDLLLLDPEDVRVTSAHGKDRGGRDSQDQEGP